MKKQQTESSQVNRFKENRFRIDKIWQRNSADGGTSWSKSDILEEVVLSKHHKHQYTNGEPPPSAGGLSLWASKESRYSVTEGFSKVLSPYVAISKNFRLWLNLLGSFDRLWKPLPVRQVPTVPGGSGSVLDIATCGGGSHGNMTLSNGSSCRKIQHRNKGAVEFAKMFIAKSLTSFIIFLYVLSIRSTDFSSRSYSNGVSAVGVFGSTPPWGARRKARFGSKTPVVWGSDNFWWAIHQSMRCCFIIDIC